MNDDTNQSGSLEQLGIHVQTNLPEGIMSPADSKAVRFTQTRPGYHFREVEAYKDAVDTTLEAYGKIIYDRDMDVYNLGAELDRARVDIANLRHQIEVYEYTGGVAQADATDEEVETLLNNNAALQAKIVELEEQNGILLQAVEKTDTVSTTSTEASNTEETEALLAENAQLQTKVNTLEQQISEMSEWAAQAEAYVMQLEAQLNDINNNSLDSETYSPQPEEPINVPAIEEVEKSIAEPQVTPPASITEAFPGITEDDLR